MVILDTSIIIDHLRSSTTRESWLLRFVKNKPKSTLAIAMITVQELYEGRSTLQPEKERDLLTVISPLKILPYSYETAKLAGKIARDLSSPIELADAAIAASCILQNGTLFTLNTKDFEDIPDLELLDKETLS